METRLKEEVGYESLYRTFLEFEEYTYKAEEQKYSEFLMEWQQRQTSASEGGLTYPNLILAFKLLRNSCLGLEANFSVFSELRTCEKSSADFLAKTLNCLNEIMVEQFSKEEKQEDLEENSMDPIKYEYLSEDNLEPLNNSEYESDPEFKYEIENSKKDINTTKSKHKVKQALKTETGAQPKKRQRLKRPPSKCKQCQEEFKTDNDLVCHLQKFHQPAFIQDTEPCNQCKKRFSCSSKLKRHIREVHQSKATECPVDQCGFVCTYPHQLTLHHATRHSPDNKTPLISCDKCGEEIPNLKMSISKHMKTHFEFKCQPCRNKKFETQEDLDKHILGHDSLPCDQCDKVFTIKWNLDVHRQNFHHPEGRKFACDVCGQLFFTNVNLIHHKMTHEEKRFVCQVPGCAKAFVQNFLLTRHMLVHTKEKNFKCQKCGNGFGNQARLQQHMDRHEGVKRAQCEVCEKRFFDNYKLKVHMRIHTGERPYQCVLCDKTFVQKNDFQRHMKKLHPGT